MSLRVDTTRAFRTPNELAGLVRAVAEATEGTNEANWIEWKVRLDLDTPKDKHAVARTILGFSNRSPEIAAAACQGVAYMVIGAEPQNAPGTTPMDHATLSQKLSAYLDDGPRWTAFDVDHDGVHVLVVVVEAPRDGDPIHALKRAFDKSQDGTVFHRRHAGTEQAKYDAMQMLQKRLLKGGRETEFDLDLDVRPGAPLLWRLQIDADALQQWMSRREAAIQETVEKPPLTRPDRSTHEPVADLSTEEKADEWFRRRYYQKPGQAEEFEGLVRKHLSTARRRLLDIVTYRIVETGRNKVSFLVKNTTAKSAKDVQLVIRVPRGSLAIVDSAEPKSLPSFPQWPSSLGIPSVDPYELPNLSRTALPPPPLRGGPSVRTERTDTGSEITVGIGDLTPGETRAFGPITLIVGPRVEDTIDIELVGRSMDRSGSKTVPKSLPLSDNVWYVEDLVPPDEQPGA